MTKAARQSLAVAGAGGRRLAIVALLATVASLTLAVRATTALAEPGMQSELTAMSGQGAGLVSDSPTAQNHGTLFVEGEVNIHDALPNTTFVVQRAVDFAPGDVANGVCTIAQRPPFGWLTEATITTSPGGAGSAHISGPRPPQSGTRFNIIFRVRNQDGTQLLMSSCMTLTVK